MLARVITAVLLGVVGLVFGMLGTVVHSSTLSFASLPWGVVAALLALACLLTGIRLVTTGRLYAACAGLGALVAIGILSQRSFGGSVLIVNDTVGWVWMGGAVVIAVLAVGWPRARVVD